MASAEYILIGLTRVLSEVVLMGANTLNSSELLYYDSLDQFPVYLNFHKYPYQYH